MLKEFKDYGKFKELIDISEFEVKFSLVVTILILISLYVLKVYENFSLFKLGIMNLTLYLISGLFTMLGFTLAGMAIIITLFKKEVIEVIKEKVKKDPIQDVLYSFQFLAFIIILMIIFLSMMYLFIQTKLNMGKQVTYISIVLISYCICFILTDTVALINNCIKLYQINAAYSEALEIEKSLIDRCNEIRIDFILQYILQKDSVEHKEFKENLILFTKNSNDFNAKECLEYFDRYYKV